SQGRREPRHDGRVLRRSGADEGFRPGRSRHDHPVVQLLSGAPARKARGRRRRARIHGAALAHVPAKWVPVRRQEHAPNVTSGACSDSEGTEHAQANGTGGQRAAWGQTETMMADVQTKPQHDYHLVDPSPWPVVGAVSAFILAIGLISWMHHLYAAAPLVFGVGVLGVAYTMVSWWRDVIKEAQYQGYHKRVVQISHRYGMILFIASDV